MLINIDHGRCICPALSLSIRIAIECLRSHPAISSLEQELIKRFSLRRSFLARGGNYNHVTVTGYGSMIGDCLGAIRNARFYASLSLFALRREKETGTFSFLSPKAHLSLSLSLPLSLHVARIYV